MTKGLKENEPNGRDVYSDIIDHPHHQSPTRPHMSLYARAAQFSSFDALAGFSDMIKEEQRETGNQQRLEAWELEILSRKLGLIADAIAAGELPTVSITYFVPDEKKDGGSYETITDTVKKVDTVYRRIVLNSKTGLAGQNKTIDFSDIITITGEAVDKIDSWFE